MDGSRFDDLTRALGAGISRRQGLRAALGLAGLAAGATAAPAGAKRRCRKDSPAGQCCKKRGGIVSCTCTNGGAVCGANCCTGGQACQDGQCVTPPPPACLEFGEACKNAGRTCCAGLVCSSGQGGLDDVACHVGKLGACTLTSECAYGLECRDGRCQVPLPPPTCDAQLGEVCGPETVCCAGACGSVYILNGSNDRGLPAKRCCVEEGLPCTEDRDCCCISGVSFCNEANTCLCLM